MLLAAIVGVLVLGTSACMSFQFSGAQVTTQNPAYTSVGEFDIVVKVNEFLGTSAGSNLFNVTADKMDPAIRDAIQQEIARRGGDAAVDLTIQYKASFWNLLFNGMTASIWAPAQAHVTAI